MKSRAVMLAALLIAALAIVTVWGLFFLSARRTSGPIRHEAYVWQRVWTGPVREAVVQHGTNFAALAMLKAEVSWKEKKPQVVRVPLDYGALSNLHRPFALALRIGPYAGPFLPVSTPSSHATQSPASSPSPPTREERAGERRPTSGQPNTPLPGPLPAAQGEGITDFLCDLAAAIVAEARTNHAVLSELQIDFDCAESKLDGYRVWLTAIQQRVAPLPVTITALPSWLDARAFKRLATVATNYVLQVHSVERPKDVNAPFTLCDPRTAERWVDTAGRIGVPFRVALPTYGYVIAFDKTGKFIGLSAEGPRRTWPEGARTREIFTDPLVMAELVEGWKTSRPEALRGVIWYRLPTRVDNFNWRWPTLGAIVASRSLQEKLRIEPRRVEAGLVEIKLVNSGELDISSRLAVEVRWSDARLMAGDALRDFELADRSASAARFQTKTNSIRLPAGDFLTLGWLRFDRDCEVRCELKKL